VSTESAVALLVGLVISLLLLSIRNYLGGVSTAINNLRTEFTQWKEDTLRECIRRPEFDRHVDEQEREIKEINGRLNRRRT
jgi:hypothetical protein